MMHSVIQGLLVVGLIHTATAACGAEEYNVFTDSHVNGGIFQTGVSRLEDCQARCNSNPECTGVDFTSASACWVITNGLTALTEEQGTNHYRRSRTCTTSGRDCTFEYLGRFRATGTSTSQVTIEACLESCQLSVTCLAVAYQSGSRACILLVDTDDIAARAADASYVMYGAADCASLCEIFTPFVGRNGPGGTLMNTVQTEDECKEACINNLNCFGVDFGSGGCYVNQDPDVANGLGTLAGNTFYLIDRSGCGGTTTPGGVSPTGGTTTLAGCNPLWSKADNLHAFGGTARPLLTTEAECLAECAADNSCFGADVNSNPSNTLCWHHLDIANLDNTEAAAGTALYTLIDRCPGVCNPTWTVTNATHAFGGVPQTAVTDPDECLSDCAADAACLGVDLNFAGGVICWFHSATTVDNTGPATNNWHYKVLDRCPSGGTGPTVRTTAGSGTTTPGCVASWTMVNDTHAIGGQSRGDLTTAASCLAACVAEPTCVAVDISFGSGVLCWMHLDAANLDNVAPETNTYHYILNSRCAGQCFPVWDVANATHAFGGVPQTAVTDPDECLSDCAADPACLGVDLNFAGGVICWFHSATTVDNTGPATNNWHYELLDRCPTGRTTTPSGPTGSTGAVCTPSWAIRNGTHAFGGLPQVSVTTADECLTLCAQRDTCVAVDLDFNSGTTLCWLHENTGDLDRTESRANTWLYQLVDRCPGSRTTSPRAGSTTPGCVAEWAIANNTHANGGTAQPTLTTAVQCLQACVDNGNCVALDLDFSGNTLCWLHLSVANLDQTEFQSNTWFYRLIDRCPTTGCVPEWRVTNNTHAFNGQEFPSATTAAACRDACVEDSNCMGVDIDFNAGANLCWKHFSVADFSDTEGIGGVYLYELVDRCPTVGTITPSQPDCVVIWNRRNNTNAFNGQPQVDITDPEVCLRDCADNLNCAGADLDFNPGAILCWFHFSDSDFNDLGNLNNAYSYELTDRCQGPESTPRTTAPGTTPVPSTPIPVCRPEWEVFNHTHAFNGVETPAANMADCLDSCARDLSCVGVDLDFTFNSFLCWFHRDANDFVGLEGLQDTYVYRLLSRCGEPVTNTPTPPTIPPGLCFADLVFVVDNSGSMLDSNWNTMKSVIKDIINDFPVNRNNVRVGLVTFSDNAVTEFDLDDYGSLLAVNQAIDRVGFAGGRSNTPDGLRAANTMLQSFGGRSNVQDVVILMSDGHTTVDEDRLAQASNDLRNRGARVYAIGVVPDVDYGELYRIVSNALYVYSMNDFTNSNDYMGTDVFGLCEAPPSTPAPEVTVPTTTPIPIDQCDMDLALVVDSSGSITEEDSENWPRILNFLKRVVSAIPIPGVRIAGLTFSDSANVGFFLQDHDTVSEYHNGIDNLVYSNGNTNTTGGLRAARMYFFNAQNGDRPGVRNAILLITDGKPTVEVAGLTAEANAIKARGIEVLGVGVTTSVDSNVMRSIVSQPSDRFYFFVDEFSTLVDRLQEIVGGVCHMTVPTTVPLTQCLLDIVLVVDESGSIEEDDPNNWSLIQNFLVDMVGRLDTSKVQLAAVTFGNDALVRFNFNNGFSSKTQIQNDIRRWTYRGGNTNTTGALRATREEILDPVLGGNRMSVRDVILLITDGNNTREINELPNEVARLKNQDTTIVGVGVTSRIDIDQLQRIVTAPSSDNFFFIENFDALLSQIDNILQRSCFQVGR